MGDCGVGSCNSLILCALLSGMVGTCFGCMLLAGIPQVFWHCMLVEYRLVLLCGAWRGSGAKQMACACCLVPVARLVNAVSLLERYVNRGSSTMHALTTRMMVAKSVGARLSVPQQQQDPNATTQQPDNTHMPTSQLQSQQILLKPSVGPAFKRLHAKHAYTSTRPCCCGGHAVRA